MALAVAMTFPNVTRLAGHTPGDYGDAYFYQWLLRWGFHALVSSPADVFDANIFWPAGDTLAYSDTMLAVAPVAGVLGVVVGPVVAFNLIYLATWVASLACTYVLARRFVPDTTASILAAVIFTFAAVRLQHYVHLQLLFAFLVPLATWLLLRFLEERSRWQAVALGVTTGASVLVATYWALAITVALATIVAGWLVWKRFRPGPGFVTGALLAVAVATVLAGPVVWKYRAYSDVLHREYDHRFAAHPGDLLAPAMGSYLYGPLDRRATRDRRDAEHRLFPGLVALVLAGAGATRLLRRSPPEGPLEPGRRTELALVGLASVALFVLAFGRYQLVGGQKIHLPFALLSELGVPGFDSMRAVGRFMVYPLLGLALLAAVGFARLGRSRPGLRTVAGVVVGGLLLLEYATPIHTVPRVDTAAATAVNEVLRDLGPGPVLELPMADARFPLVHFIEPPRMVWSSIDWQPRVNGASAFTPPGYQKTVELLNGIGAGTTPQDVAIARLQELGVRYVVVRTAPIAPTIDLPGVTHYDATQFQRVLGTLGPRVERARQVGAAVLIELRV